MRRNPYPVFLAYGFSLSFLMTMIFTASAVYQVTVVGLSPLQLVLVGTLVEAVVLLFEIPTGIVADVYSRRLSVLISIAMTGVAFLIEGLFPSFEAILLAQVVWGIGATFESGAIDAWVVDEMGEAQSARAFQRGAQLDSVGTFLGVLAGMATGAQFGVATPVWLGGLGLLGVFAVLAVIMPERHFTPVPTAARGTWRTFAAMLREGAAIVRRRPVLRRLVVAGFVQGAFSEGFDRLWTPLALTVAAPFGLQPIVWLGIVRAIAVLAVIPVVGLIQRRVDVGSDRAVSRALVLATAGVLIGLVGFAVGQDAVIFGAAYVLATTLRRAMRPILQTWTNNQIRGVEARARATVLSFFGQVDAIGQVAGGPPVGAIGNLSLRAAILTAAAILAPAMLLYRNASGETAPNDATQA